MKAAWRCTRRAIRWCPTTTEEVHLSQLAPSTSGYCNLRKFDVQTGKATTLATGLEAQRCAIFVTDDVYYHVKTGSYPNYVMEIRAIDLATGTTSTLFSKKYPHFNNALGVDPKGNVYLSNAETFDIFSKSGKLLYTGAPLDNGGIDHFIGFDGVNGNFYFQSTTNWLYWGYGHTMACLKVGNFNGSAMVYKSSA